MLVPVGRFNLLHDDDYWDIPRRTLTDRDGPVLPVKSAWRDLGAGFVGSWNVGKTGKFDYQLMALNGASLDLNVEHELNTASGSPGSAELVLNSELQLASGFFDGSRSTSAFACAVFPLPSGPLSETIKPAWGRSPDFCLMPSRRVVATSSQRCRTGVAGSAKIFR